MIAFLLAVVSVVSAVEFADAPEGRSQDALDLYYAGKYEEAAAIFQTIADMNIDNRRGTDKQRGLNYKRSSSHHLGQCLIRLRRYEEAEQRLARAIELEQTSAPINVIPKSALPRSVYMLYDALARAYFYNKKYGRVITTLNDFDSRGLQLDQGNQYLLHWRRGRAHVLQGNWQDAARDLEKTRELMVQLAPGAFGRDHTQKLASDVQTLQALSHVYEKLGQYEKAREPLRAALELAPNDAESQRLLDVLELNSMIHKQEEKARKETEKILADNPDFHELAPSGASTPGRSQSSASDGVSSVSLWLKLALFLIVVGAAAGTYLVFAWKKAILGAMPWGPLQQYALGAVCLGVGCVVALAYWDHQLWSSEFFTHSRFNLGLAYALRVLIAVVLSWGLYSISEPLIRKVIERHNKEIERQQKERDRKRAEEKHRQEQEAISRKREEERLQSLREQLVPVLARVKAEYRLLSGGNYAYTNIKHLSKEYRDFLVTLEEWAMRSEFQDHQIVSEADAQLVGDLLGEIARVLNITRGDHTAWKGKDVRKASRTLKPDTQPQSKRAIEGPTGVPPGLGREHRDRHAALNSKSVLGQARGDKDHEDHSQGAVVGRADPTTASKVKANETDVGSDFDELVRECAALGLRRAEEVNKYLKDAETSYTAELFEGCVGYCRTALELLTRQVAREHASLSGTRLDGRLKAQDYRNYLEKAGVFGDTERVSIDQMYRYQSQVSHAEKEAREHAVELCLESARAICKYLLKCFKQLKVERGKEKPTLKDRHDSVR